MQRAEAVDAGAAVQRLAQAVLCVLQRRQQCIVARQRTVGDGKALGFHPRGHVGQPHQFGGGIQFQRLPGSGVEQRRMLAGNAQRGVGQAGALQRGHVCAHGVGACGRTGIGLVGLEQGLVRFAGAGLRVGQRQAAVDIIRLPAHQCLARGDSLRGLAAVGQHADLAQHEHRLGRKTPASFAVARQRLVPALLVAQRARGRGQHLRRRGARGARLFQFAVSGQHLVGTSGPAGDDDPVKRRAPVRGSAGHALAQRCQRTAVVAGAGALDQGIVFGVFSVRLRGCRHAAKCRRQAGREPGRHAPTQGLAPGATGAGARRLRHQ